MVMNITKMIELFQKNRVPYLRKHVLNPPNNHTAIISQWARWWIEDTNNSVANRGIFDEAIGCEGKRRADIMFLEQSSDKFFEIKGVAEIENNIEDDENKYLEKLYTLKLYDESTDKFPNLEFVILSTLMIVDKNNTYIDFFSSLLNEAKKYSKESSLSWVICILCVDFTKASQEVHIPDYIPGYDITSFRRYAEQGGYVILQNGKELSKVGWPE